MVENNKKSRNGNPRPRNISSSRRASSADKDIGRPSRPGPKRGPAKPQPSSRPGTHPGSGQGTATKLVVRRRPMARRPSERAAVRKSAVASRPMPAPPTRRVVNIKPPPRADSGNEALLAEVEKIQQRFVSLETEAQLSGVYSAIGNFDHNLVELPTKLDTLRDQGYVHSGQLDDQLVALDDRWDQVRPRVERALRNNIQRLDRELDGTERRVSNLRANKAAIDAAESAVNSLTRQIDTARSSVESLYDGMEIALNEISNKISKISRMMDLLDESQNIRLFEAEGALLAVDTQWQRDGKDGPEGILFLTDQRLLFEQREEIVTKKVFGIFKADSEKTQNLLLNVQVSEIESVSNKEEGGFLGMGKDDILEFVFAATAPISRARFHLKGQDSADWATMIKRVQTGEVDEDRADEYVEELEAAKAMTATFPDQCPNCFAALPSPPRGAESVTCEFCSTVVTPQSNELK